MRILKELYLKPYNAYMLRDDSLLFECNTIHPYIKYLFNDADNNQIEFLFNKNYLALKWFFDHTFHYIDLLREVYKMTENEITTVLKRVDLNNPRQERCFDLYLALALFAADRFGDKTQILLKKIFKYSFAPLLEDLSVTLSKLNEHVLDSKSSLLNVIR